jgi:type I restriction enzyme S subunit
VREGWKVQTLGDACSFQRGLTYSKADEVDYSNNAVLRANNIDLANHNLNLDEIRYISDNITVHESKKVKNGSIIICTASGSKTHLGKVAFIDRDYDFAFGGFMGQITPKAHLNPRYLFYVMTSQEYKSFIDKLSNGVNINNLKFSDLQAFSLEVPPLPEQKRIVAILDQILEGIDAAAANAEKNITNSRELFESYLQFVFNQRGDGWERVTLDTLLERGWIEGHLDGNHGGDYPRKE